MKKLILCLFFLLLSPNKVVSLQPRKDVFDVPTIHSFMLRYIKHHEGLKLRPYKCGAGYSTIGYGHKITNERFSRISVLQADSLLLSDFNKALFEAKRLGYDSIQGLAVGHLIYSIGVGRFVRSKLHSKLQKKCYTGIKKEWLGFSYLGAKKSLYLLKMRKIEYFLFTLN